MLTPVPPLAACRRAYGTPHPLRSPNADARARGPVDHFRSGRLGAVEGGRPAVLLCTHTGIPWQRRVDDTLIVNVGAVGRPANDGRRETWYALLEFAGDEAHAELVPLAYDWRAQAGAMRAAGL